MLTGKDNQDILLVRKEISIQGNTLFEKEIVCDEPADNVGPRTLSGVRRFGTIPSCIRRFGGGCIDFYNGEFDPGSE